MSSDMDPHILNFYEDLDLPLASILSIIDDAFDGRLADPCEKLDGQNFTFTVDAQNDVRFMGKGCARWIRAKGGLSRQEVEAIYADRPDVQRTFLSAYDVIKHAIASVDATMVRDVFGDRARVVRAEIVSNMNPNIIRYKRNALCMIASQDMGTDCDSKNCQAFDALCHAMEALCPLDECYIGRVPMMKRRMHHDTSTVSKQLRDEWSSRFMSDNSLVTMGDLVTRMIEIYLMKVGITDGVVRRKTATRLAYDSPRLMPARSIDSILWEQIKPFDDERAMTVGSSIIELERFFSRLGNAVIDAYEFSMSDVDDREHIDAMKQRAHMQKKLLASRGVDHATKSVIARAKSAAERCDEKLFTRNVEGVVFRTNRGLRKLVGGFTCINRLNSYFAFGGIDAR